MRFDIWRGRRQRLVPRSRRLSLVMLIVSGLLGVASSPTEPAGAQAPTPPRPLILIGGTFVGEDFDHFDWDHDLDPGTPPIVVKGWWDTKAWLESEGGYTDGEDLFVIEMKRQVAEPAGWNWEGFPYFYSWPAFVADVEATGGSTAGLAPMQESVDQVKSEIVARAADAGGPVDIAAHSQSAVIARAAIRQLESDSSTANDGLVRTLVSLGGPQYGIAVDAPEFQPGDTLFIQAVAEMGTRNCRNTAWLPVCRDLVRNWSDFPPSPGFLPEPDWQLPDPYDPRRDDAYYDPWTNLYVDTPNDFFIGLNDLSGVGPVPRATASVNPTRYFHIYSRNFDGNPSSYEDHTASETIELYDPGLANVQNRSAQGLCGSGYAVDHVLEWQDPATRKLMSYALGFDTESPDDVEVCSSS
jgi:Palmitoyl protein thioesterase